MEDGLIKDGLWDVHNGVLMGNCAEKSAKDFEISREEQDQYAIRSYHRAQAAWKAGQFDDEIAPVVVTSKSGSRTISRDEGYDNLQIEKMKTTKPAFSKDGSGSVTAANASTMNDGASAVVLANYSVAKQYSKTSRVLSKIISSADASCRSNRFLSGTCQSDRGCITTWWARRGSDYCVGDQRSFRCSRQGQ